ncbi:HlyD family type I secretion periplasmic adaptor subunit [Roseovarius autotrophicus]|uniref:HlyD family type I secretion periplasmic adaptor subunit n=1 Tax=Roseovarius autotrophicus TaxID=2824121 RepID=UPI0019D91917|nr:HlyD family type I secretion periplasmic adaptor subunit [Roseovarius autotrophicus]MBE0454272.1 HlyD family type I secretion periplasmic adaptor subunit [Roseovarius sp.]
MTADAFSAPPLKTDLTSAGRFGILAGLMLLTLVFGWAYVTQISGAVIASGSAVVRGKPKMVQSLDGGIVEEIRVSDGDLVQAGHVLLRLDPTLLRINLEMYHNRLAETRAEISRLRAEQVTGAPLVFDYDMAYLDGVPLAQINAGQREIFEARREVMKGRKDQLAEKIAQFHNQISGVDGLITAKREQLAFLEKELADVSALHADGLAREGQVLELQRARSRLLGEIAEHQSELARIRNSIRDTELEILQSERQFKEQVVTDLRRKVMEGEELLLQIVTARKQLDRIEILSPVDGIVHEMQIFNTGSVVPPGETIMQIVPVSDGVDFEIRVDPNAIDQVAQGQRAKVVFSAFSTRSAPEIFGTVSGISPSSVLDPVTGQSFYRVTLAIAPQELARLEGHEILPGMPIEAFLQTGERTVLSYLTRPLSDQLRRAFRDD